MCLKRASELKIAEKDLCVLKVLSYYDFNRKLGYSFFQSSLQRIGQLYRSVLGVNPYSTSIEKGLHSIRIDTKYKGDWFSALDLESRSNVLVICLAVIPKGSKYIIGKEGDIVSNKLMILEPIISSSKDLEVKVPYSYYGRAYIKLASKIVESYYGEQKY